MKPTANTSDFEILRLKSPSIFSCDFEYNFAKINHILAASERRSALFQGARIEGESVPKGIEVKAVNPE